LRQKVDFSKNEQFHNTLRRCDRPEPRYKQAMKRDRESFCILLRYLETRTASDPRLTKRYTGRKGIANNLLSKVRKRTVPPDHFMRSNLILSHLQHSKFNIFHIAFSRLKRFTNCTSTWLGNCMLIIKTNTCSV